MPIIRQQQSRAFKDISLSFKRHPVTNDILALTNEDAIKRSVRNLVETVNEERFFNPLIGSHLRESLFELPDNTLRSTLKTQIENTIQNFEPRVDLTDVVVNHPNDTNDLEVTVSYDIIGQEANPQELTFILQPTRA
jgi:phage baseplate assembly protein W